MGIARTVLASPLTSLFQQALRPSTDTLPPFTLSCIGRQSDTALLETLNTNITAVCHEQAATITDATAAQIPLNANLKMSRQHNICYLGYRITSWKQPTFVEDV